MTHNLIPPFILRETNIIVNDVTKIQSPEPDETTHYIWFPDSGFRIALSLRGFFSYFLTRKTTKEELVSTEDVLVMTPQVQNWDPNFDVYARNEENMTNWEENLVEPRHCVRIMIEDLPEIDSSMAASAVISVSKYKLIENMIKDTKIITKPSDFDEYMNANNYWNNVHVVLSSIWNIYDPVQLHDKLLECRNVGVFACLNWLGNCWIN